MKVEIIQTDFLSTKSASDYPVNSFVQNFTTSTVILHVVI